MSDAAPTNGAAAPAPPPRQFVQFVFYKVDQRYRALPAADRAAIAGEVEAAVASMADRMQIRAYTLVGIRGDADFMFWHISESIDPFQEAATRLLSTRLGEYLTTPYAFLAMTRKSQYVDKTESPAAIAAAARRLRITPGTSKYLFVYPFVKTRPWYALSAEQRQSMMDTHIRVGRKYPSVKLNTTYSFGLDDQEFVVSFETDEPGDFLDLVMELREAESSLYTLRDTPTFTCVATTVRGALDALGTPGAQQIAPRGHAGGGWTRVAAESDVQPGAPRVVYVRGEQVALFSAAGRIYAIEARCPHASGPLAQESTIDGTVLTCTRHGSQFDLSCDAAIVRGPAARSPVSYDVKIEAGEVYVAAKQAVTPA
jgi:chlorite dismutase